MPDDGAQIRVPLVAQWPGWGWRPCGGCDLARRAGYADGQILPIKYPVWRFYRLVP